MGKVLAFNWNSSNKTIEYFLFDDATQGITIRFGQRTIQTQQDAKNYIDTIYNNIQNHTSISQLKVRHKILFASPVAQNRGRSYGPNQLSLYIKNYFDQKFATSINKSQRKNKLKGPQLKKFQNALLQFQMINQVRGNAYKVHLWSYALDIKKGGFKGEIKKLWKLKNKLPSHRLSTALDQQFEQWYRAL